MRSATIIAAAALLRPGALPAVIVPSFAESGPQLGERLDRGVRAVVLVLGEKLRALCGARTLDRHDLVFELAGGLCRGETLL